MFNSNDLKIICHEFDIECIQIGDVIDTSKSEADRRFNYKINAEYFLKINNSTAITEGFLQDISSLTSKYRKIGVYCPSLIKSKTGNFAYYYEKDNIRYVCYIEEYAPYTIYNSKYNSIDYAFRKNVVRHLGKLAKQFSNIDLSKTNSMWSLIELGPFDIDKDEKQENLDSLISTLKENQFNDLANKLVLINHKLREHIEIYINQLPRCVYQGDLNDTNILVDAKGEFKGIIDFNMFGTEVNINCFLNETMYYIEKSDFDKLTAQEIFSKMNKEQNLLLSEILVSYNLNNLELHAIKYYKKIIYLSFYPNVVLWNSLISKNQHVDKVLKLINIILDS